MILLESNACNTTLPRLYCKAYCMLTKRRNTLVLQQYQKKQNPCSKKHNIKCNLMPTLSFVTFCDQPIEKGQGEKKNLNRQQTQYWCKIKALNKWKLHRCNTSFKIKNTKHLLYIDTLFNHLDSHTWMQITTNWLLSI